MGIWFKKIDERNKEFIKRFIIGFSINGWREINSTFNQLYWQKEAI